MIVVGISCVVLGGLVAAATGPLDLAHGSWVAAYLVLVAGVAQCAMGYARLQRSELGVAAPFVRTQLATWNLGHVLVVGGTLISIPLVVSSGSVLLIVALAIALSATRASPACTASSGRHQGSVWALCAYQTLLLTLAVCIPVGVTLSYLRHS